MRAGWVTIREWLYVCALNAKPEPACVGPIDLGRVQQHAVHALKPGESVGWDYRRRPVLDGNGTLRIRPEAGSPAIRCPILDIWAVTRCDCGRSRGLLVDVDHVSGALGFFFRVLRCLLHRLCSIDGLCCLLPALRLGSALTRRIAIRADSPPPLPYNPRMQGLVEAPPPDTAPLRKFILEVLPADSDLDGFCMDYFRSTFDKFATAGSIERRSSTSLLQREDARGSCRPLAAA